MKNKPGPRHVAAGDEAAAVVASITSAPEEQQKMLVEAGKIFAQCPPSQSEACRLTGLVIGLVQSGKTANFETVMAMARDNDYRMIVLIGGTSVPLFDQSNLSVGKALRLDDRPDRAWLRIPNPSVSDAPMVRAALNTWRIPMMPRAAKQTVLLTVMKHAGRIAKLNELLGELDLEGTSVLVIDDEADQAGLNTKVRQGDISATYREITDMRALLPAHAFLQYTATPQALLLISILDELSPEFVHVLTPGNGYVGGRDFFNDQLHIRIIPASEVPTGANLLAKIPESLLNALASFVIAVALGYYRAEIGIENRSMMVHPSRLVDDHADYHRWIMDTMQDWGEILGGNGTPLRTAVIARFRKAHVDLAKTYSEMPVFSDVEPLLQVAVSTTAVHKVNAGNGKTPPINWQNHYGHILVGGQAMDRGFVVRGLITTYMPRGIGLGHADVLQQRARFFGYRRHIFGLCRVFLEQQTLDAYKAYVQHEDDVRERLVALEAGADLKQWRREFILSMLLKPTRPNILLDPYMQMPVGARWMTTKFPWLADVEQNRDTYKSYLTSVGAPKIDPASTQDLYAGRPLKEVLNKFLVDLRWKAPVDTEAFTAALARIVGMLRDNGNEQADIYFMQRRGHRAASREAGVEQLMQGRGSTAGYPGDRKVFTPDRVSIQVHDTEFRETDDDGKVTSLGQAPAFAIRFPERATTGVVVQRNGGNGKPT